MNAWQRTLFEKGVNSKEKNSNENKKQLLQKIKTKKWNWKIMKCVSVVFVSFVLLFLAQGCISSFTDLNKELKKIDVILENWDSSKIESYKWDWILMYS